MPTWFPRRAQAPLVLAGILTLALAIVAVFPLVPFAIALRVYLVGLAAIASVALVRLIGEPYNRLRPRLLGSRQALDPPAGRPAELEEIERAVEFATWSKFGGRHRLQPAVSSLARERLQARRGIDLDREPERALAVLGPETMRVARPGADEPADTPVDARRLRVIVEALERI